MSTNIENIKNGKGTPVEELIMDEKPAASASGMKHLLLNLFLLLISVVVSVFAIIFLEKEEYVVASTIGLILAGTYVCIISPIYFGGLKVLKPKEALVLTLFGQYFGTLKGPGFFFVNPFVTAAKPETKDPRGSAGMQMSAEAKTSAQNAAVVMPTKKISLKAMTLSNDKQKINDAIGNPIIIGIVVIWQVVNTAKAVFNVDNYTEFLSIQSDSALRNVVRLYPYDVSGDGNEKTLRGSSLEVAEKLKSEIQEKVMIAGIEIIEAKITHLSYAPEIAAAMLQRQQASAIIDARQMIVEGAVGMVEMALQKLNEHDVVHLDEERKAAMVSNLLVVLCGNKDAQPIVNSGSLY
jgi:regulator of protease activity HflC (stomatin/prohibitin superfamily)